MIQAVKSASIALSFMFALYSPNGISQNTSTQNIVPIIMLLLDGDNCLSMISTGDVIFDKLDPTCLTERLPGGQFAAYYSFIHPGGPIHIDLISDFPSSYDTYLIVRIGVGRDGPPIAIDDDGHDDALSSRFATSFLAAGEYTIEASSFQTGVEGAYSLSVYAGEVTAFETFKLNDTGVRFAGDSPTTNSTSCNGAGNFSTQDCSFGRDADSNIAGGLAANDGDGQNGFSFLKVSSTGEPLSASASNWSCVKDNVTGLLWQVKTDNSIPDLHDKDHTFSWYNPDPLTNNGNDGVQNGGTCFTGVSCDTSGYAAAVNAAGLCGYNDWRVPTARELLSLSNMSVSFPNAAIDSTFFPNTPYENYWSASPLADASVYSWVIGGAGFFLVDGLGSPNRVRLVRNEFNFD